MPTPICLTLYDHAMRYVGIREVAGDKDNYRIMAWLTLDHDWPKHDEVPWCSGWLNEMCWQLKVLPRSKSLLARSWLGVGTPVSEAEVQVGFDIVILKRGSGRQPGPENRTASGHVGLFAGFDGNKVLVLGGNQSNEVSIAYYPKSRVLGYRRLKND